jgi:hypothetical protein
VCPGCGGPNFKEKHPSCGYLTCCVSKNGFEVCSDCKDYPCTRFDPELQGFDSFVTHKNVFTNLRFIQEKGIGCFIDQQKIRMDILMDFLSKYDDGRSKNFFCISCALLPIDKLREAQKSINNQNGPWVTKEKNKLLKQKILMTADNLGITLKLNNKPKT